MKVITLFLLLNGCLFVSAPSSLPVQQPISQEDSAHLRKCMDLYRLETEAMQQLSGLPPGPSRRRDDIEHALAEAELASGECNGVKQ